MADKPYMLYVGSSGGQGPQDLYRPALVFAAAIAAKDRYGDKGDVKVALLGDAVYVMDRKVAGKTPDPQPQDPHRRPKLQELIDKARDKHIEIHY